MDSSRLARLSAEQKRALLARLLRRRFGVSPLVLGGPDERGLVRAVLESAPGAAVTLDALLSVSGLSALHARALLVIAADSGPLHFAALIGTPVLGLYGPADPAQFAPLSSPGQSRIVRVPLPCSPCGTLLHPPCGAASNPACITGIGVGAVLEAATELAGAAMATR